ncbi:hypothetical protein GOODEAATRI_015279 [Goodea atripinnis]|uniref:ribonuclease H n=1 Tax=Goodea atripinnis TaxID=208336 RepID=A0ABV0NAT7_9TELE
MPGRLSEEKSRLLFQTTAQGPRVERWTSLCFPNVIRSPLSTSRLERRGPAQRRERSSSLNGPSLQGACYQKAEMGSPTWVMLWWSTPTAAAQPTGEPEPELASGCTGAGTTHCSPELTKSCRNFLESLLGSSCGSSSQFRITRVAACRALEQAKQNNIQKLVLYTDSKFTINGVTSWVKNWKLNGWRLKSGGEITNKEDFVKLDQLNSELQVVWVNIGTNTSTLDLQDRGV